MDNELGILIQGSMDVSKTVSQINSDLVTITSQIKSLNLNIDTSGMINDVKKATGQIDKELNNMGNGSNNVGQKITDSVSVDMDKLRKNHADAFKEIDKLTKHYNGAVTSIKKQGGIDLTDKDDIEKLNRYNIAIKDLEGVVRNFQINNTDDGLQVVGFDEINNIEKAQKETQKLADQMGKLREQSKLRVDNEQEKSLKEQNKWINKNADDSRKQVEIDKKKTDELEYQIQKAKELAKYKRKDLERRYGSVLTNDQNKQLDDYINSMNRITPATKNSKRAIEQLNTGFKGLESQIKATGSKVNGFGANLKEALSRINW